MADVVQMTLNTTMTSSTLPPLPNYTLSPRRPLLESIPDNILSLILPVVAYWSLSMVYHLIDVYDLFPQYRLHTPVELLKRNRVTRWEVARDVVFQQFIQTIAGLALAYFDGQEYEGKEAYDVAVWARRIRVLQKGFPYLLGLVGIDSVGLASNLARRGAPILAGALAGGYYPELTVRVVGDNGAEATVPAFAGWELAVASFIYWYFIPAFQFVMAVSILDTWQYFWHRAMHLNRWLYGET